MSRLENIYISGIRSYGIEKEDAQCFKFYSPLTLFLGQNGCGKTTIIEAIKHALTGEFPGGGGSGAAQGFVSNPYMHHVPHVKGAIKLKFRDSRGNIANVIRVMKCEKTISGGLKFSTLDSSLKYIGKNGMENDLDNRIDDINKWIINLVGVPKAILNNVIFCHQESSLWPLDKDSDVKKKFDDIFDSAKYNKCVTYLREQLRKKEENFRLLRTKLDGIRCLREEVNRKKNQLKEKQSKYDSVKDEVRAKEEQLRPINERLSEIITIEENLIQLQNKLAVLESERKNLISIQATIKANIKTEFAGSDAELQQEIQSFDMKKQKHENKLKDLEKEKQELGAQEEKLVKIIQEKTVQIVQIKEQKKDYASKLEERKEKIVDLMGALHINSESIDIDNDSEGSMKILKKAVDDFQADIQKMLSSLKTQEKEMQSAVDNSRKKVVQTEQAISLKEKEIKELQRQFRDFNGKLNELNVSDERLKSYEKKIKEIDKDLERINSVFKEEEVKSKIDSDKREIRTLEENLKKFEGKYKILHKNAVTESELENLKCDVLSKKNQVEKLRNNNFDQFQVLFETFPESDLKRSVQQLQQINNKNVTDFNRNITRTQEKVTQLESEIKHAKYLLKQSEEELEKNNTKVKTLCGDTEYNEKVKELEVKINRLQKNKGQWSAAKVMYEKFVEDISSSKCCPICTTNFSNKENAITEIVDTMKSKIISIPNELEKMNEKLIQTEKLNKSVVQLKPVHDKIEELEETLIPKYTAKLAELNQKLDNSRLELDDLKTKLKEPQNIVETCSSVISSAVLIDQHRIDITRANAKIDLLEKQLVKLDSDHSLQQVETEIEQIKIDLVYARNSCDQQQEILMSNNKRCQELRSEKNSVVQKQLDLQKYMQGRPQLEERIAEINEKEESCQCDIEELKVSLIDMKSDLDSKIAELSLNKDSNEETIKTANAEYHGYSSKYKDICERNARIKQLSVKKFDELFNENLESIEKVNEMKARVVEAREELFESINDTKLCISNEENCFRSLKDNQSLREKRKEQDTTETDLIKLKEKIGNLNYRSIRDEKVELENRASQINRSIQTRKGNIEELENVMKDLEEDLSKPNNKNVDADFMKMYIETKVIEQTIKETKIYSQALENAICTMHRNRMKEINKNIRQLWRLIYRGNDIDYIEIESDIGFQASNRRKYSYRVMQKKKDTLIEMRGHCSSGQKVLACLIIRIALAEIFSSNCSILALDEPTTNLDRENISSLSQSLANIVATRKEQSHFQLLIITHDEEFLRTLRSVDCLKYYYDVSRNNNGNTVITSKLL
ncbi:PREDICTED: DNA repair protein RAD50 [Nicrophorus vespilloides]|uniref:DNA repair protein RAD50 n=1 Tax=Nicrophorus vespilloides TaxID=110193 RepID=A0ABM1N6U7_NICVS|nr:PREDICTED: DNA repair protein RAD50 [Nicrophorus vespilloides]